MMARVLICGSDGMLGRRLVEEFSARHEVVASSRRPSCGRVPLDITDPRRVDEAVAQYEPDWVVNAAAYTAVDRAETEEKEAFLANETGPSVLAEALARRGRVLLHVSTDFVFSGEKHGPYVETDPVGPEGAYARSKEAGERRVREAAGEHLILRISWLFGPDGRNFVDTMLRLGRERPEVRVVDDQTGTPTFTRDAAKLAVRLLEAGVRGTVHGANEGETTWRRFAEAAIRGAGYDTPVVPIRTEDYPTPAKRPRNSALRNGKIASELGYRMRPWPEALAEYLAGGQGRP